MKIALTFAAMLLLIAGFVFARQGHEGTESCGFAIQGDPGKPTVSGPDDLLPLVHVVAQPDSPLEIVSIDLRGTWLSVSNEQHDERECAKYKVRNRSNQGIQHFDIMLRLSSKAGGGGSDALSTSALLPRESAEVESCGVRGRGSAPGNQIQLLIYVESVDFRDCRYKPSLRIPNSLGVHVF